MILLKFGGFNMPKKEEEQVSKYEDEDEEILENPDKDSDEDLSFDEEDI